jgi:hypothetical protein
MAMEGMPLSEREITELRRLSRAEISGDEYRARIREDFNLK